MPVPSGSLTSATRPLRISVRATVCAVIGGAWTCAREGPVPTGGDPSRAAPVELAGGYGAGWDTKKTSGRRAAWVVAVVAPISGRYQPTVRFFSVKYASATRT